MAQFAGRGLDDSLAVGALGYGQNATALWNSLIVGALLLILAVWDLNTMVATPQVDRGG
jgi:SPW repeat-containing protein